MPTEFFGGNAGEFAAVPFGLKHNLTGTATLNQLIFDGSYLVGLQSAKTYLKISENAKEKTEIGIREAIINAYGNVLLSEEGIRILENNIANKLTKLISFSIVSYFNFYFLLNFIFNSAVFLP